MARYVEEKLGIEGSAGRPAVAIYCAESPLSESMTLGTAKAFCWKQAGPEMVLAYAEVAAKSRR